MEIAKFKKTVFILGASSDIGIETVKYFLNKNWIVFAHYNKNSLKLKKLKEKNNKNLLLAQANLSSTSSVKKLLNKLRKKTLLSFVNLVGYLDNISFEKLTINSLLKSVKINSVVPLFIQRELLKGMIKKKFGRILNISSIGIKYGGSKYTFNYSYSKNTLEYFPRYLKNLTKKNILSNILRIGVVNTKLLRKVREKNIKKRVSLIPIKRAANISEVVKTIYSLASEENTYISGETINIAGGE